MNGLNVICYVEYIQMSLELKFVLAEKTVSNKDSIIILNRRHCYKRQKIFFNLFF